jgi:hypothetical protein
MTKATINENEGRREDCVNALRRDHGRDLYDVDCGDIDDTVHLYFETIKRDDWVAVGEDAAYIYSKWFDLDVEDGSPIGGLMSATAAAGWDAALRVAGRMLGVEDSLPMLVEEFVDGDRPKIEPGGDLLNESRKVCGE